MSALETTVRVNSEKQTLILAGEPIPRPGATAVEARGAYAASLSRNPLTLIATPVDDPLLLSQSGLEDLGWPAPGSSPNLAGANNPAGAYARTQQLSVRSTRSAIIDTYA
jgi:hypothetical protein